MVAGGTSGPDRVQRCCVSPGPSSFYLGWDLGGAAALPLGLGRVVLGRTTEGTGARQVQACRAGLLGCCIGPEAPSEKRAPRGDLWSGPLAGGRPPWVGAQRGPPRARRGLTVVSRGKGASVSVRQSVSSVGVPSGGGERCPERRRPASASAWGWGRTLLSCQPRVSGRVGPAGRRWRCKRKVVLPFRAAVLWPTGNASPLESSRWGLCPKGFPGGRGYNSVPGTGGRGGRSGRWRLPSSQMTQGTADR